MDEGTSPEAPEPVTRRSLVPVLVALLLLAGGVVGWQVLSTRSTTERHRSPITAVRVTDDGRWLTITALSDGCYPDAGAPHADVEDGRLVLTVVQVKEVPAGDRKFCWASCHIDGGGPPHMIAIDPEWAGLTMVAGPDDGHCALSVGPGGSQRAPYLGTVPPLPQPG